MQANPMRAALERGELQIGTWVNLVRNPAILLKHPLIFRAT